MNMCEFNINKIRHSIREYNLRQLLKGGGTNMIDEELNKEALEKLLDAEPEPAEEKPVDLQQTLNDIESDKLFEDIINLKNKK